MTEVYNKARENVQSDHVMINAVYKKLEGKARRQVDSLLRRGFYTKKYRLYQEEIRKVIDHEIKRGAIKL